MRIHPKFTAIDKCPVCGKKATLGITQKGNPKSFKKYCGRPCMEIASKVRGLKFELACIGLPFTWEKIKKIVENT